jgi:hypothetical protein
MTDGSKVIDAIEEVPSRVDEEAALKQDQLEVRVQQSNRTRRHQHHKPQDLTNKHFNFMLQTLITLVLEVLSIHQHMQEVVIDIKEATNHVLYLSIAPL